MKWAIEISKENLQKGLGILFLVGVGIFILFGSSDHKNLDIFAQSYSNYRSQQYETNIGSILPIADSSITKDDNDYFTYLSRALDATKSSAARKVMAQTAVINYEATNQKMMDDFAGETSDLGAATSKLVEVANRIKNDEYRDIAIEIGKDARQLQQGYEELRKNYAERFSLQLALLKEIIANEGALRNTSTLRDGAAKIPKINEDSNKITKNIEITSQKMSDLYASLKGRAELKDYPDKFATEWEQ